MAEVNPERVSLSEADTNAAGEEVVVPVAVDTGKYDIHVSSGLLGRMGEICPPPDGGRGAVITCRALAETHAAKCLQALRAGGWTVELLVVPDGEGSKSLACAEELYNGCLDVGLDRGSTVFAVGGGVVGDLAGFVAGTYMRGIRLVQAPTTLLAQVDASVGGKTAVDLPRGKNLVGVFHQPALVAIDTDTLATLPDRELRAGMAEIVKHAAIADREMFAYLEDRGAALLAEPPKALRRLIARNCQIKAEVVVADPREQKRRACLNYGHTIGHALELAAGDWDLRHGEAVAFGMVAESRLAVRLGLAAEETANRQRQVLRTLGLTTTQPRVDLARAEQALAHDKKVVNGALRLPLVPEIGRFVFVDKVGAEDLIRVLRDTCTSEE